MYSSVVHGMLEEVCNSTTNYSYILIIKYVWKTWVRRKTLRRGQNKYTQARTWWIVIKLSYAMLFVNVSNDYLLWTQQHVAHHCQPSTHAHTCTHTHTHTQWHNHTHKLIQRCTRRQKHRYKHTQTHTHTERHIHWHTQRHTHRNTYRHTNRGTQIHMLTYHIMSNHIWVDISHTKRITYALALSMFLFFEAF
jgi:hypothetical protein